MKTEIKVIATDDDDLADVFQRGVELKQFFKDMADVVVVPTRGMNIVMTEVATVSDRQEIIDLLKRDPDLLKRNNARPK